MAEVARRLRRVRRRVRHSRRAAREQVRIRRHALRHSRYRHAILFGLLGVGGLIVLGALWILITGLQARTQIRAVEVRLAQVRTLLQQGDLTDARLAAKDLPGMCARAHRLTTGPAWWLGSEVPYLGDPLSVVRSTTSAAASLGDTAVPALLDVADDINPDSLRVNGDSVNLKPLQLAAPKLAVASRSLDGAVATVQGTSDDTWLGALNSARDGFLTQLQAVGGYVDAANRASAVIPQMLGADGQTHRYFVGLQNEAEMRGTGGIPGAFAIVATHDGTITFERFESDSALLPAASGNNIATGLDFGSEYDSLYGSGAPTEQFNDSNVSPNFPYAAQIWAAMWQKQSGEHLDGALALDPTALSYFLAATGPAAVADSDVTVSAANVVQLTQQTVYSMFPDNTQRKQFLVNVLKAAADKLTSGDGAAVGIVQAASRAAAERRLLVWTSDAASEKLLEQSTYAGDIQAHGDPFTGLILNNSAAGKLDYYLQRSVSYSRTGCGATRSVSVSFTLLNTAPSSGLPAYVTTRLDAHPPANAKPGDSRTTADYYATGGALLESATVNGRQAGANVSTIDGRTVFRFDIELPIGQPQTVQLNLQEPAMSGAPTVWVQPGVQPVNLQYYNQTCG